MNKIREMIVIGSFILLGLTGCQKRTTDAIKNVLKGDTAEVINPEKNKTHEKFQLIQDIHPAAIDTIIKDLEKYITYSKEQLKIGLAFTNTKNENDAKKIFDEYEYTKTILEMVLQRAQDIKAEGYQDFELYNELLQALGCMYDIETNSYIPLKDTDKVADRKTLKQLSKKEIKSLLEYLMTKK